jgi:Homeodomain-like domain-containing protein
MRPNIPQNLRIAVIGLYSQGESRNEIASRTGISQGSVSNIISAWKKGLDESEASDLRDLGIMMKRAGLTPIQCASGFRIAQLLNKSGVNEGGFKNYIFDFYKQCVEIGLDPQKAAEGTKQLLVLCETVPIWQLSDYIASKIIEKAALEESVTNLKKEEIQTRTNLQNTLNEQKTALRQIEYFNALMPRLEKAGVRLNDLELFVKSLESARELGYDSHKIVRILENLNASMALDGELQRTIRNKKESLEKMEEERSRQELVLATNHVMITKLKNLESMGFELKDLTILSDTAKEIAVAYDIPVNSAVRTFLKDIAENYEPHLGYQERCKIAQRKLDEIKRRYLSMQVALTNKKKTADVLALLLSFGYNEQDIMEFAYKLRPELRPIEPPASNSTGGISMNMWTNLTQNKTSLQPNTASKKEDTQEKQTSQPKPFINSQSENRGNLQPGWDLQFKHFELISSASYKPAKTFEMDMREVKDMCEYSYAVKCGNILAESTVPINIPYQT